ncbi:metallophosphoesterase [Thermodesulfatator indicus DSM 15286]|uniref:Metallophosphoesterase n=1 Tax=Thermodesulfatator indicus (strain DSM 15286 / JCM 11887 / CIR29812) TaxID=667014 RepID=F8A8P5_THEID|nr:TIGR00282 family metallophosphoesterase [Thermodesulfatator indicus]AEH45136.1 metallophosphoesterase [Thermodesulfatator indicus DSM 15286]
MPVKVLFVGDIVGRPGRKAVNKFLTGLIKDFAPDFVIGNAENAAGGYGLTEAVALELFNAGFDLLTSGNHIWRREFLPYLAKAERILRPANYPAGAVGKGYAIIEKNGLKLGVINLEGRVFMRNLECPFRVGLALAENLRAQTPYIIVDFHAEATSEKLALGWHLDGKVSAVIGTHTHVQTGDERILPEGTAYLTDVGMTGIRDGVIGMRRDQAIEMFLTQVPRKLEVPKTGPKKLEAVYLEIENTGKASFIKRLRVED